MTNLDFVREEMERRGCSKLQINSKTVAVVMDIMANTDRAYSDLDEAQKEVEKAKKEAKRIIQEAKRAEESVRKETEMLRNGLEMQENALREKVEYIENFNTALSECETAEERDNMRKVQLFVNLVDAKTSTDNAAFIMGLAAIISGEKIGTMNDVKKINCHLT